MANLTSVYDEHNHVVRIVCRIEEYWEPKIDGMDRFVKNVIMVVVYSNFVFFVTFC